MSQYPVRVPALFLLAVLSGCDLEFGNFLASAPPDTQPPSVQILSPTRDPEYVSRRGLLPLSGLAVDAVDLSSIQTGLAIQEVRWRNLTTGSSAAASGRRSWRASVALARGENEIEIEARDPAGNVGRGSIRVTYDPRAVAAEAWGRNGSGQLGSGGAADSLSPLTVTDLPPSAEVSGGGRHSVALLSDGTLRAWGANDSGQLGDGTTEDAGRPVPVEGAKDVRQVSAGGGHTVAVRSDGSLLAWGRNKEGQLGLGTSGDAESPQPVGLGEILSVSSGDRHTLALQSGGVVWAWGDNRQGQAAVEAEVWQVHSPRRVALPSPAVAVEAGGNFSMALLEDGTVFTWGGNESGQLGDGSTEDRWFPSPVAGVSGALLISAGGAHALALDATGTLLAWGENALGQLGIGSETPSTQPVAVQGISQVIAVSAGGGHTVALRRDGTVRAWGGGVVNMPSAIWDLYEVRSIDSGGGHTVVRY